MDMTLPSKGFKGIIFDKDGTLFDFQRTWSPWMVNLLQILCDGNEERSRREGYLLGFDLDKQRFLSSSLFIAGTPLQFINQLKNQFKDWKKRDLIKLLVDLTESTEQIEVVPLQPIFTSLQGDGYVLGLATNDSTRDAKRHLVGKDLLKHFDFVVGFDSGYKSKPDPEMLLAFCHRTKIPPKNTVMVGDSNSDLIAGKRAGMFTVAVLSGVSRSEELEQNADLVIRNISDLQKSLEKSKISE